MSGPVGPTRGPRFSGGYQFPRTHSARLERGTPIRVERLGDGAYAQIVPLSGSAAGKLFEISGEWTTAGREGPATFMHTELAYDELQARAAFMRLVAEIGREKARCPST